MFYFILQGRRFSFDIGGDITSHRDGHKYIKMYLNKNKKHCVGKLI